MTKKKASRESVRRSTQRRRQEERQKLRSRLTSIAAGIAIIAAVVVVVYVISQVINQEPDTGDVAQGSSTGDQLQPLPASDRPLADVEPADRKNYYAAPPEMILDERKDYEAIIHTEKGPIKLRLFSEEAPITVNNFVFLAREGFYDGLRFHRVIEDFMAQGGDPSGQGGGGPGYTFEDETESGLTFDRPGLLAMANRGPATNGSQFFITYVPTPQLDGKHTIFGEVIDGEEVLNSLSKVQPGDDQVGDEIIQIDIFES